MMLSNPITYLLDFSSFLMLFKITQDCLALFLMLLTCISRLAPHTAYCNQVVIVCVI